MILIPAEELKLLMAERPGWCVSLFMPTHRKGEDTRQDPIRLQNLLRQAKTQLIDRGVRPVDANTFLEPALKLEGYSPFWRHLSDGLAMFLSQNVFRYYRLPFPLDEQLVVAEHFYIKPLLPLLSGDGRFYILALSQNQVKLLLGTRYSVGEIDLEDTPKSLAELLEEKRYQKQIQFHTRTPSAPGKRIARFFGHGESDKQAKQDILRYFKQIDAGLSNLLQSEPAPLVLAGVDYLLPLYRSISKHPHLMAEGISGNPEEISAQQLHERAWKIVEPYFKQAQHEALERFEALKGTPQTSIEVNEIIPAAYHGQVQMLFVALGVQQWGSYDPHTSKVERHTEALPGDEDLLQFACNHTLLNGGQVFAMDKKGIPGGGELATIYRY